MNDKTPVPITPAPQTPPLPVVLFTAGNGDLLRLSEELQQAGLTCECCDDLATLCQAVEAGVGAMIISKGAMPAPALEELRRALERQPAWSNLPVLVLADPDPAAAECRVLAASRGVTFLGAGGEGLLKMSLAGALAGRRCQLRTRDRLTDLSRDIRRRETFLDLLGHELRNPLAALRHVLDACRLRQSRDQVDPEGVAIMSGQLDQAARLVDELLDASRLARRELSLEKAPVMMADVVGRAVEATDALMGQRGHTLELSLPEQPVRLLGDRDRLVQVVTQLLTNAARYTPEGKPIRLSVELGDKAVVLRVREDGRGIPPGRLARIFEPFAAMDEDAEPRRGGLGLGLSVARRLVELHGGRITARSAGDGQGSEFEVSLPIPEGITLPATDPGPGAVTVAAPVVRRVLVVDDDQAVANTLARLLAALGHQVKAVYRGQEALQAVRNWEPEVVLLDLEMPYMDGYEVAQRLREYHGSRLGLVALTGHGGDTHLRKARKAGFDRFLLKPVFVEDLQALLAEDSRPPDTPDRTTSP